MLTWVLGHATAQSTRKPDDVLKTTPLITLFNHHLTLIPGQGLST